ncbi:3,4-dihydroxy-2-butanone-4-phosphate synthase [Halobellus salinus]|uniref:3,4-dihydroxy-2-butanone 4-phosphate synthase n=1 Tax=Halobellus salinus TaxID=931585 RepID=A0A830EHI0_9EURY|nr:3,4-dihydroxy-2-butanone-4-phosphate synthase [Halobellus salinus]GGJ12216.1 3,4-dihydroxy-2-butanone-4-phosphate synthase [Halobellus salinus]SMP29109.1 3,4-dihydroxy-2-butanone 4-phosphate synthase [Halobellus salinus]
MTRTTADIGPEAADGGAVDRAVAAFQDGNPVLIHDAADREGETDIVYPASAVDADAVAHLREDAGGLICTAVSDAVADAAGLPFLEDELDHPAAADHDLAYDNRSSFSLPVNHRETFTGITDDDRALTIRRLADAAATAARSDGYDAEAFATEFRTPGHVHVLRGAPDLLADRRGHTELGLAVAAAAGLPPAAVVCEMLDAGSGGALTPTAAREYAQRNGYVYVEGAAIVDRLG